MKNVLSLTAVLLLALNALGASPSAKVDREAELREAVESFGRAFLEADVAALRLLLTDNYVHVNGRSGNVLNRADWLKWIESRRQQIDSKELQVTEYRIEDVTTFIHGDTAIVTGTVFSSQVAGGEFSASRIRFSNTWLYRDAKWLRAAFHDSPVP